MEPLENIALTMDLSGVEFIEKCHKDKGVEDDGKVFSWSILTLCRQAPAAVYVQKNLT